MKTTFFKILVILALSPAVVFSNNTPNDFGGRYTKEKKLSRSFTVSPNAMLKIDNSYGNIDITTWDRNTVSIEVFIKTNGNDEQKVREKLDQITVEFNQTNAGVNAKTHFSRESNSSWWSSLLGSSNNVNMEINYVVRAPASNSVDLNNDYGHIFLDKLTGNARINCDYGRLDIGELHGEKNELNFDYSRNSRFGFINRAVINADYSEFTIEDAGSIDLNADYTTSKIKRVEAIKFNCDYGSLTIDKLKRLNGKGSYLSTRLGDVHQEIDLRLSYGSLTIDRIVKGAGEININSDYTGVKIGYDPAYAFRFDIKTAYANVKGIEDFEVNKQNQASTSRSYSGYYLNSSARGNVILNSNYGNINFLKQ